MSSFYFGYCNVYLGQISIGIVLELLNFDMDKNLAKGLLNGAMPAGALFGAMGSSILLRKFSRRYSSHNSRQCLLLVNCFGIIVGAMLYIQNFYCFLLCRICQGYVVGTYSVITPLIIK
jgi:MFS family permease